MEKDKNNNKKNYENVNLTWDEANTLKICDYFTVCCAIFLFSNVFGKLRNPFILPWWRVSNSTVMDQK